MFSLESPHRGDSNEYTQHAIINIKKKTTLNYHKYDNVCSYRIFSLRTQERVRNSRGKRAISVRSIEVLLYFEKKKDFLAGSPLLNEITQTRDNRWDPCCTLCFHISCTSYFYRLLSCCTMYFTPAYCILPCKSVCEIKNRLTKMTLGNFQIFQFLLSYSNKRFFHGKKLNLMM